MDRPLLALTLIQPWAHAMLHMGKRLENRTWAPGSKQLAPGDWFALHAGATLDREELEDLAEEFPSAPVEVPTRAVVGLARLDRIIIRSSDVPGDQRCWWNGPIGWLLYEVRPITPVPCKGALGLWPVPAPIRAQIEVPRG